MAAQACRRKEKIMPKKTITLNLNAATLEELANVKQIGAKRAKALIDYRKKNGPFEDLSDLLRVDGFDEQSVDDLENSGASLSETEKIAKY